MRGLMEDVWPALPASVDYAPGGALHETDESFTVGSTFRRGRKEASASTCPTAG